MHSFAILGASTNISYISEFHSLSVLSDTDNHTIPTGKTGNITELIFK